MPNFDVKGVTVHYEVDGAGSDLVLLHSGGASSTQWRRFTPLLNGEHRLIAPDFFGFGKTGRWPGPGPLSHDAQADLVAAVISHAASTPVDMVGHSYGGATAIRLALRWPNLLRKLILIEPILPTLLRADQPELFDEYRQVAEGFIEHAEAGRTSDAWALFLDYRNGRGTWDSMAEASKNRFYEQTIQTIEGFRSNLNNPTTLSECQSLKLPTLILCGAETTKPDEIVTEILQMAIPSCRYSKIAGAGHMSPLSHPDVIADLIRDHLAMLSS